jgi:primosomal protein N' (replication factor Y) (superfamily II helicase)
MVTDAPRLALDGTGDGAADGPAGSLTPRRVEVAVDAAGGAGTRLYTYAVPESLADLEPGEAVLVEFGRRQALGVVLGDAAEGGEPAALDIKPILERVRADGPILPRLSLELARWVASHYLAPASLVVRAMLPPGMLERLELVAEATAGTASVAADTVDPGAPAEDRAVLDQLALGPRAVRRLDAPAGRADLLRRLHALAASGLVTLDWTLTTAGAVPRYERRVDLTAAGADTAAMLGRGETPAGRRLGPRQTALLAELGGGAGEPRGTPAPGLAERHGASALRGLVDRGLVEIEVVEHARRPLGVRPAGRMGARPPGSDLTPAQAEAVGAIRRAIEERDPTPLVLDGVTGAGKTAVYVEAILASLEAGRPILILVPEIPLALPLVDRLRAEAAGEIALLHSGLGDGERADEWRRIRAGEVDIVVGTRSAILAPLPDVGLVVVDEEHDGAYKSDRTPRVQARDAAVRLAALAGAACVLGSATPAVETIGRARAGEYRRIALPERPTGVPPVIEVVDLRAELADGNRSLLSRRLADAIAGLDPAAGDRAILVINRRGTASAVLCRDCGHAQACPDCGLPLVFHQAGMSLRCHHCGSASPLATRCPACGSPRIRYLGAGTQRVEAEVRHRFPRLRVARLDRDVVERRGAAERILDGFAEGRSDVLVGTSLVTKALDIPEVTLVGVVSADIALNLPDERAAERTYQLLVQATGRAGRGDRPGLAIIQSYQPEHRAIRAAARADPASFYDAELASRERWGAPPFGRYVKLTVALADPKAAESEATEMADRLRSRATERDVRVDVIGPAPAYIARRADRWRWNVVLRGPDPVPLLDGGLGPPWSVDVDPDTLL